MLKVVRNTFVKTVLFSIPLTLLMGGGLATADSVDYIVNVAPSFNITLSANNVTLDLNPNTKTSDAKDLNIKVSTNNMTGYYLTMSSTGDATDLVRDNTADGKNATIPTLSAVAGATANTLTDNTWGYKQESGNFIPYVSGTRILENRYATNEDETTLSFASKINYSQAAGSYELDLTLTGVANPALMYMQDFDPAFCTSTPQTVVDMRDNKEYTIARLADGQCWMTSDLNLAGGTALYSDDSDVDPANTRASGTPYYTLPNSSSSGFSSDTVAYVYNTGNETTDQADCNTSPGCNSYYSWLAATAGGKDASGTAVTGNGPDVAYSICPKGWRLPKSGNNSDTSATSTTGYKKGDSYKLATAYGANLESSYYQNSAVFYQNAGPGTLPNFLLAGYYSSSTFRDGGSYGYYWSSSSASSTDAYNLAFGSSVVYSASYPYRRYGFPVRCVLEDTRTISDITNMQDINSNIVANTVNGTTKTMKDVRDDKEYNVRKIGTQLWMIDNLKIGLDITNPNTTDYTLTPANSDVTTVRSFTAYDQVTYGNSNCNGWATTSGAAWNTPCVHSKDLTSGNNTIGMWYNYAAASAGTIMTNSNSVETIESICPRGWRLPSKAHSDSLVSTISPNYTVFNMVYGGWYGDGTLNVPTTYGGWWTSTATNATQRYIPYNNGGALISNANAGYRSGAIYVRCVAR